MAKPHLDIKSVSVTNTSALCGAYGHNTRTNTNEDWNHIDPTKTYLNHDLVNPANVFYRDLVVKRLQEASIEAGKNLVNSNSIVAFTLYLAYTHGAETENGFTVQQWEQASLKWMQDYFGERNVVSAMVHMDESSPHIHAIIVPITRDGRLSAKDYVGGSKKLSAMWASYGQAMSMPPFHMEYAQSRGRKANHASIKKFYAQLNEIDDFKFPEKEENESVDAYIGRMTDYVKAIERKAIADRMKLEEDAAHAEAEKKQVRVDYRDAINLQQYLQRKYHDSKMVSEELMRLYLFEQYPKDVIDKAFSDIEAEHGKIELNPDLFFGQTMRSKTKN